MIQCHIDATSPRDHGNRVGRDLRTIHRWECGAGIPSLDDLLLLVDTLGVQPREFFE